MKLQIIAIFYNAEKTVRRCLDSILSQDVGGGNILSVIAVDDFSKDETRSILEEYHRDANVLLVFHEQNKGISEARNSGMKAVDGDCFYFIDGDDYLPEGALNELVSKWENDADWVQGGYNFIFNTHNVIISKPDSRYCTYREIEEHFQDLEFVFVHNRLINAKWSHHFLRTDAVHEDRFWNVEVFPFLHKIITVSTPTYNHMCLGTSFSSKSRSTKAFMESAIMLMEEMLRLPDCWAEQRQRFLLCVIYRNLFLWGTLSEVKSCWKKLDRNYPVSMKMSPPIAIFPASLYCLLRLRVPDVLILLFARFYRVIQKWRQIPV